MSRHGGLDDPALGRLWDTVAERLQRNGLLPRGIVTIGELNRAERFALSGLVGRHVSDRVRVDLAALDDRIRETGAATGLVAAVTARRGSLVDRPGERAAAADRRNAVWESARDELAASGLEGRAWVEPWLESARPIIGRSRRDRGPATMAAAVHCLATLPWDGGSCGRGELATRVAGSSHSLDDGTVLAALVLRAVSLILSVAPPTGPAERRALWERAGVLSDEVSTTVLTLGLHPIGDSPVAVAVRGRSQAGCESHLTLRDLRRLDQLAAVGTVVWVSENPRVLEAAMDAGSRAAMMCTAGNPTVVVTTVLDRLLDGGAELRYHGDFDWPGVAIGNRVLARSGTVAWRMAAPDYEAALAEAGERLDELPRLEGAAVPAVWDPDLMVAMQRAGRVVHEEAVLDLLVADVVGSAGSDPAEAGGGVESLVPSPTSARSSTD